MKVKLSRIASRNDGVFGTIAVDGMPIAVSLERPWLDNKTSISCIPAGIYTAKRVNSPKFGNVFEVTNVPNRKHILIHSGNIAEDTQGCIIIGESFNVWSTGQCSVASSRIAFAELMQLAEAVDSFEIEIAEYFSK